MKVAQEQGAWAAGLQESRGLGAIEERKKTSPKEVTLKKRCTKMILLKIAAKTIGHVKDEQVECNRGVVLW